MLKILHLKLQSEVLRQILPHWIVRLEFNFRRKISRLEFYLKSHATKLGKILARNSKLRNFVAEFLPEISSYKIQLEIPSRETRVKFYPLNLLAKFYDGFAYRNFTSIIKICSEIRRKIPNYKIPRWISSYKIQEKFHAKLRA